MRSSVATGYDEEPKCAAGSLGGPSRPNARGIATRTATIPDTSNPSSTSLTQAGRGRTTRIVCSGALGAVLLPVPAAAAAAPSNAFWSPSVTLTGPETGCPGGCMGWASGSQGGRAAAELLLLPAKACNWMCPPPPPLGLPALLPLSARLDACCCTKERPEHSGSSPTSLTSVSSTGARHTGHCCLRSKNCKAHTEWKA
jgi:hypothetical protein